jgi:predicted methyltransferase
MADDVDQCVENVLNVILSVTEKSRNLRNDLRKDILKAASELRITFTKLKSESEEREKVISKLEGELGSLEIIAEPLQIKKQ